LVSGLLRLSVAVLATPGQRKKKAKEDDFLGYYFRLESTDK
jgi:hypothetical protein